MFCKFCGTQMNDGDLFCPNCGKKQTNESRSVSTASTTSTPQQTTNAAQTVQPQATAYVAKKSNTGVIGAVVGVVVVVAILLGYMFVLKPQQEDKQIAKFLRSINQNELAYAVMKTGVNAKGNGGWTALMLAARENNTYIAKLLINAGADPNTKKDGGVTALIIAVLHNSRDVAQMLMQSGANINAKDNYGKTAFAYAQDAEMAQLLRNAGARR